MEPSRPLAARIDAVASELWVGVGEAEILLACTFGIQAGNAIGATMLIFAAVGHRAVRRLRPPPETEPSPY